MEMRALINLYRKLYDKGIISDAAVERHNELVKKYRKKLMKSYDSKTGKIIKRMQFLKKRKSK